MRAFIAAAVVSTFAMPALAQQPAAPATTTTATQQAAPMATTGQWRASQVIGVNVYNEQNERLGDIKELLMDQSGRVAGAIIGVGGFLGMGEHDVMVPLDRLRFSNEAGTGTTGTTGAASGDRQWHPDRAVMNATREQLKDMRAFEY